MKISKSILASVVIASAMFAGTAAAATPSLDRFTSSTNVNISVKDGVATLFGSVDNGFEKRLVANAAAKIEGVDSVRNLITFSN